MNMDSKIIDQLLVYQKNEITEHNIYKRLAKNIKSPENSKILLKIAKDEIRHYSEWKSYTHCEVKPSKIKIAFYYWISRIFGFTFGVKLMERGEEKAQREYDRLLKTIPEIKSILHDENEHEDALLSMLDERHLQYTGSIVLGLNDALVELTGALAGLTLALQNTKLIALTGLITGIAASLSMAASEYLSIKSEGGKNPLTASTYTGMAYILTVAILVLPFLLVNNYYLSIAFTLAAAVFIIAFFNYYLAVVQGTNFKKRFFEMAGLSFGVAGLSFGIGLLVRIFLNVDI